MYFAGYMQESKGLAVKLLLLGITATLISLVTSLYLSYAFNREYRIQKEFGLQERLSKEYTLDISERDVVLVSYNVSITGERTINVTLELLDANGLILHSKSIAIDRTANLVEQVSTDGSLDRLAVTIENEEWGSAEGHVDLTYTRSPAVYSLASIASAFIGIGGAVVASFGLLQYLIHKTEREGTE